MIATGMEPRGAPAMSSPQKNTSPRINSLTTPTGMVLMSVEDKKTRA